MSYTNEKGASAGKNTASGQDQDLNRKNTSADSDFDDDLDEDDDAEEDVEDDDEFEEELDTDFPLSGGER